MGIEDDIGYIILVLVIVAFIIILCVINKYYHIQLCERWGTEWFLSVKVTRRHQGCPLRITHTNFSSQSANQNRGRTDFSSPSGNSQNNNNNSINVNLISQTTCNINIHVTSGNDRSTADGPSPHEQHRRTSRQTDGCDGGGDNNCRNRNYGIFSTMTSSCPVIRTDTSGRPEQTISSTRLTASNSSGTPAFGKPPPSFESVTSSQGADPALFRQSSISSHSHSPPPSFENSFLFEALPSVEGTSSGFLGGPSDLPDYESLNHGPPPAYDSIFPS